MVISEILLMHKYSMRLKRIGFPLMGTKALVFTLVNKERRVSSPAARMRAFNLSFFHLGFCIVKDIMCEDSPIGIT